MWFHVRCMYGAAAGTTTACCRRNLSFTLWPPTGHFATRWSVQTTDLPIGRGNGGANVRSDKLPVVYAIVVAGCFSSHSVSLPHPLPHLFPCGMCGEWQYRAIVDWCGCSPNVFMPFEKGRLVVSDPHQQGIRQVFFVYSAVLKGLFLTGPHFACVHACKLCVGMRVSPCVFVGLQTHAKQPTFFARKFDPRLNMDIINFVERKMMKVTNSKPKCSLLAVHMEVYWWGRPYFGLMTLLLPQSRTRARTHKPGTLIGLSRYAATQSVKQGLLLGQRVPSRLRGDQSRPCHVL